MTVLASAWPLGGLAQAGTFMYHGHLGIAKTAGLFGLLIAQETKASVPFPVPYAQDLPLVLTDWYHLSIDEQVMHRTAHRTVPASGLTYCGLQHC